MSSIQMSDPELAGSNATLWLTNEPDYKKQSNAANTAINHTSVDSGPRGATSRVWDFVHFLCIDFSEVRQNIAVSEFNCTKRNVAKKVMEPCLKLAYITRKYIIL